MSFFKNFFQSTGSQSGTLETNAPESVLNPATHVTAQELIGLQQQARKLDLNRNAYASASTTGSHRSRFRGRGMDYQESRFYQAGDDIRNMDWRVTARSGKPHTKLYQEERERPVVLLVDFNPGMFFGSKQSLKSVVAARTAALIAWSVAARGDRIGALLINENHHELSPKMGKRGALQLIRELVNHSNPLKGLQAKHRPNSLNEELKRLRHVAKPGSLVFIISDFYEVNEETSQHLRRIAQHNDIQAIQIVDPLEIAPPPPNLYNVTDGKRTGLLNTRSKKVREQYAETFQQHHQKLKDIMQKNNVPLLQLSTTDNLLLKLQQNFGSAKPRPNKATTSTEGAQEQSGVSA